MNRLFLLDSKCVKGVVGQIREEFGSWGGDLEL